ncbi:TPA: GMC family oxidoreductase [Burkholderia multivorans]|uniref:GMC family oxidoreductase n=1 Tax=Burkholderia multivorans TaxID=87883 RepID=UPI001C2100AA|nr:GMC family oxidoreductase [Burkholderia multivorans]MBU9349144.1 GMC family oxidoreductase [Burkholderia multivorans]MBU9392405.1 GMC family oxidoreductase [Burkholderia multivorans]HDR9833746.1 GMC family oxidoreductase [Burkholderia multivorans]HDR9840491.1 GMC family oxidoreductase [Burkholderia multivorans]HDR9846207.1 GMC family oxidoreductase [Burkholderia multivorans]
MTIVRKKVDCVVIGFGWTGAILAQELTEAGLDVVALERGAMRDTRTDAVYPKVVDELKYSVRGHLFQDLSRETVTIRHDLNARAVPYRQHGSFLLGTGVGGAGFHWNGMHYRVLPEELQLRTHYEQRYGKRFIPHDMTIQDFGVTYDELEPYFDFAEKVFGTSGKAGNLNGRLQSGGNPFEGPRSGEYPTPPLQNGLGAQLFERAAWDAGFHPYPSPAANTSTPYTNPYGVRLGPCNFCGFCEGYGCYMYSKASPQTTILPALMHKSNFELRANSYVTRILLNADRSRATGVRYIDAQGREVEQSADLVIVAAFQLHNVRLLLLSGIGQPYDPASGHGTVGKNYAYQMNGSVDVLLPRGVELNPFIGSGAGGVSVDDLNGDRFDHGPGGFVGGANIRHVRTGGRPIKMTPTVPGTPAWGSAWKRGVVDAYQRYMSIGISGSVMAYRHACLDLDPVYRDAYGIPLLRMTFDWHDNEFAMVAYMSTQVEKIAKAMKPDRYFIRVGRRGSHYDTRVYQSTHTTGGAIMGSSPRDSVVNKYLQSWDVPNVFVLGASAFPQNMGYNPTGLVAALAYHAAAAIRTRYLKQPGPLVDA